MYSTGWLSRRRVCSYFILLVFFYCSLIPVYLKRDEAGNSIKKGRFEGFLSSLMEMVLLLESEDSLIGDFFILVIELIR